MILAIDIGGTKMAAALVSADGTVVSRQSVPTDRRNPWEPLAQMVCGLAGGVSGVGVGSAGPLDPVAGTVSPVNIPAWRDFPLVKQLSELVPGVPVRLAGDAVCAAAGEHWLGAGQGHDNLLAIVVSTGVGGGLVQSGRLVTGPSGNAGHFGHMVVDLDGEACPCGGRGCVETYASGPRMAAWAREHGWLGVSAVELADAARLGDVVALQAFARGARALAAGIVSTAALCDLSTVVVGGGVAKAADLLLPLVREAITGYARLGFLRDIQVTVAALGADAGIVGAAALILRDH